MTADKYDADVDTSSDDELPSTRIRRMVANALIRGLRRLICIQVIKRLTDRPNENALFYSLFSLVLKHNEIPSASELMTEYQTSMEHEPEPLIYKIDGKTISLNSNSSLTDILVAIRTFPNFYQHLMYVDAQEDVVTERKLISKTVRSERQTRKLDNAILNIEKQHMCHKCEDETPTIMMLPCKHCLCDACNKLDNKCCKCGEVVKKSFPIYIG